MAELTPRTLIRLIIMIQELPMAEKLALREGRHLFGLNPDGYEDSRPEYPLWIFEQLRQAGAFGEDKAVLEIGAGTGRATRRLIEFGAGTLTIIEPDVRFADMLSRAASAIDRCLVLHESFEDADLQDATFDLVASATAFHWVDPVIGWPKLRRVLRRGGHVALFWNVLQVFGKPDSFHDATQGVLATLPTNPSGGENALPYALDRLARESEARTAGFEHIEYRESTWEAVLTTEQVGKLYEGFSHIQREDSATRERVLTALMRIADEQFGGRVVRNVTSCLYLIS